MKVRRILVPTDFSPAAEAALSEAASWAECFGAEIVVLHACQIDIPAVFAAEGTFVYPPGFEEKLLAESSTGVERVAQELATRTGLSVRGIAVTQRPAEGILEQASELPADMIVMGTRGLSGIEHVLLGSVAERVVRLAPCPVLTVSPPD